MNGLLPGYNVVEMNASDDRSPEVFRTHLEAATQMTSVMGKNPRPNCLVLDEIDGAPAVSCPTISESHPTREPHKERGDNLFTRCALILGINETSNADW